MIGIDLGLNLGSVTMVTKDGIIKGSVINLKKEKALKDEFDRLEAITKRYTLQVAKFTYSTRGVIAIEEPVYSWGRRNPKAFSKSVALFTLVFHRLRSQGHEVISVNNRQAKKATGYGASTKEQMIAAYEKETGVEVPSTNRKGKETLADSYFIAKAGKIIVREKRSTKVDSKGRFCK